MIKTIIADDKKLDQDRLVRLLSKDKEIEIISVCETGKEALRCIRNKKPSLVFLDVQIPEINGLEVLQKINEQEYNPVVVFVTASDRYALQAFEVQALDYLLKPFGEQRLFKAISRAKQELKRNLAEVLKERMDELIDEINPSKNYLSRVMVKSFERIRFLKVEEIDWIKASGNYVCIYSEGKKYLIRETMNNMEEKLNPDLFFRVHRSTIINLNKVKEMEQWYHGNYMIVMEDGKKLTMSRNYKDLLQRF